MNKIVIAGQIDGDIAVSHENRGETFYRFMLSVKRTSGNVDVIPCIISEVNLPDITLKQYVKITGEIRTRNYFDNNNKYKLSVFVFVESVEDFERFENHVSMDCYICKKNDVRDTPKGRVITDFICASNRKYGKSDYIPCIAWGRIANRVTLFDIGDHIEIAGRFQSREYVKVLDEETKETRIAYELSVAKIRCIEDVNDSEDGDADE